MKSYHILALWVVVILATLAPAARAVDTADTYRTVDGDTLSAIADKPEVYGDAQLWVPLWDANKAKLKSPEVVPGGIILTVPRGLSFEQIMTYRRRAATWPAPGTAE